MGSRLDRVADWETLAKKANYSPKALAVLSAVSLRQLERYTKEVFRQGPHEWLRRLRLRQARRLLRQGWTVKATAYALGFKQPSHFSREFKRQTGIAPVLFSSRCAHRPARMSHLDK